MRSRTWLMSMLDRVLAVPGDVPLLGAVEPSQELGQSRLPGAVVSDQRDHLARADVNVDVLQGRSLTARAAES